MDITQEEYRVTTQRGRIIHTKINVLNFDFQLVGEISGVVLDGSSYNTDATSDIRRTCSISLILKILLLILHMVAKYGWINMFKFLLELKIQKIIIK